MKVGKIVLSFITAVSIAGTTAFGAFSDMGAEHWAYEKVELMKEKGIISGFEDGTFRPDTSVTREQFASILVKTLELNQNNSEVKFEDIESNRWSKESIEKASLYLTGYEIDGKYYFRPNEPAVREDMAVAVVKARGLENEEPDYTVLDKFSDKNLISEGVKKHVAIAVKHQIMNGNTNGTFNPLGGLTRAEITALMYNVMEKVAIDDVIEPEENHIHKEVKRTEDNKNGTHKVEIYCKECKEIISSKNESHKFEQGQCECGKYELAIDVEIEEEYEIGDRLYFYTYGSDRVDYSVVEDTGKIYLSKENNNLDEEEKISIEITENMVGKTFVLNVKAYSGGASVKASERFSVYEEENSDVELKELPEFYVTKTDRVGGYIDLMTEDYEKYEFFYAGEYNGKPSLPKGFPNINWYKPTSSRIEITGAGKSSETIHRISSYAFIKYAGEDEYTTVRLREKTPDFEIDYEDECIYLDSGKYAYGVRYTYNDGKESIDKPRGTYRDVLNSGIEGYSANKKIDLSEYFDELRFDKTLEKINIALYVPDNGRIYTTGDEGLRASPMQYLTIEKTKVGLPKFELNEDDRSIYLGRNWDKYQFAYNNTTKTLEKYCTWYGPLDSTRIRDEKILLEDLPYQDAVKASKYIHIRQKDREDLGVKTVELPKHEVKLVRNKNNDGNQYGYTGRGYYWPGDEVEIIVDISEDEMYKGLMDLKNISLNDIEVSQKAGKIYFNFIMPDDEVTFDVILKDIKPYEVDEARDIIVLYPDSYKDYRVGVQWNKVENGKSKGKLEYYTVSDLEDMGYVKNNGLYLDKVLELTTYADNMQITGIIIYTDTFDAEEVYTYPKKSYELNGKNMVLYPYNYLEYKIGVQWKNENNGNLDYYSIIELENMGIIKDNKLYLDKVIEMDRYNGEMELSEVYVYTETLDGEDELEKAYQF